MIDMDKALPRLRWKPDEVAEAEGYNTQSEAWRGGWIIGCAEQGDADWEQVKALVEALTIIAEKGSYQGDMYSIPISVLNVAQAALAQLEKEEES